MIDTDEYTGHTEGKWTIEYNDSDGKSDAFIWSGRNFSGQPNHSKGVLMFSAYNTPYEQFLPNLKLVADAPLLLEEVKRLSEENKKQLDVLSTLDEMIRFGNDHFEMMKALEQGLDITETWKEMKKNE